jgi:hypothetical protein
MGGRIEFVHTGHSSKSFKPVNDDRPTLTSDAAQEGLLVDSPSSLILLSASESPWSTQSDSGTTVTMLLPGAIVKDSFTLGCTRQYQHPHHSIFPCDQLHDSVL